MFVLLKTNPMKVKNTNAVSETPRSVDDNGDDAAFGYDCMNGVTISNIRTTSHATPLTTTIHQAEATYATAAVTKKINW